MSSEEIITTINFPNFKDKYDLISSVIKDLENFLFKDKTQDLEKYFEKALEKNEGNGMFI